MSDHVYFGRLHATVSEVVDAGDLLPDFELAAIPVLEGQERPGEEPAVRRHLRAEGIRPTEHRGSLLLDPGELERLASVGLFGGNDELLLCTEWNDEYEAYPNRLTSDVIDFRQGLPLGLEDWMIDTGCVMVLGDGHALNYATTNADVHAKLSARFGPARR